MDEQKQLLIDTLYANYKTMMLSRQQTAEALGISTASLDRMKTKGIGINHKRIGVAKNATIKYPLVFVVDYIINNNIKTI